MVDGQRLTLEELARACGMTARNVRSYQSKGLIPPPAREGRRSVYDDRHVERLEAIRRAREQGASLILIKAHLDRGGRLPATIAPVADRTAEGARHDTGDGPSPGDGDGACPDSAGAATGAAVRALGPDIEGGPEVAGHVERLVAAGALRREEGRVVAVGALAAVLAELEQQGIGLAQSLRVAVRAVEAATSVVQAALDEDLTLERASVSVVRLVGATLAATAS